MFRRVVMQGLEAPQIHLEWKQEGMWLKNGNLNYLDRAQNRFGSKPHLPSVSRNSRCQGQPQQFCLAPSANHFLECLQQWHKPGHWRRRMQGQMKGLSLSHSARAFVGQTGLKWSWSHSPEEVICLACLTCIYPFPNIVVKKSKPQKFDSQRI